MTARTPAQETLAVAVAKRIRDQHGAGDGMILATHTEIGRTVADYLTEPRPRALILSLLAEVELADLRARRSGGGDR